MNTLIFGDVHGDPKALSALLTKTRDLVGPDLAIYSVGDLIDRGPDSKGVIDLCIEHGVRNLLGNHELWLHEWVATGRVRRAVPFSKPMGGIATLRSYGIDPESAPSDEALSEALDRKVPQDHREYIASGSLWEEVLHADSAYFLSHGGISMEAGNAICNDPAVAAVLAGVPNDLAMNRRVSALLYEALFNVAPERILWAGAKRNKVFRLPEGCVQVFGHTPWRGGAEIGNGFVALDTGCGTCPPFRLSGLLLRADGSREIVRSR